MTALVRVRQPSGRVATIEATRLEQVDGILWATGRYRRRVGLNYSRVSYGKRGRWGFPLACVLELRDCEEAADAS